MAVSQYLRPGSLLESVQNYLTPGMIHNASSLVGESESSTRQTMNGAVAGVLSGVTDMASTRDGAGNLAGMVREGGFGNLLDNAGSFLSGGKSTTVLSSGQQVLGKIFGGNVAPAAEAVARSGGVRVSSATKLMSLAAPLVMGVLAKRAAAQKLDSSGLANLLMSEKSDIAAAAPSGFSQVLGRGPTLVGSAQAESDLSEPERLERFVEPVAEAPRERHIEPVGEVPQRSGSRWLPLLIAALIALGVLWALRARMSRVNVSETANRGVDAARTGVEQLHLPGGSNISVAPGSLNYNLAKYLADPSSTTPRRFTFDNLNFESAGTQLTPESAPTVNNLASVLKAYPRAQVQLVGYTDNTGSPQANQTLSLNRANAVKQMLVDQGVSAERVSVQGMGQENPVASNDTEEGRLRNRRTELVVNAK